MTLADSNPKQSTLKTKGKLGKLLRELSDDEDGPGDEGGDAVTDDPKRPWSRDFHSYLDTIEHVLEGWTMVKWWGVRQIQIIILSTDEIVLGQRSSPFGLGNASMGLLTDHGVISLKRTRFLPWWHYNQQTSELFEGRYS